MGSPGARVVKLRMTPYFWRLLGKYCIVLSYRTVSRGGRRMSLTSTITGIVASYLGRHAPWIEDEFNAIAKEALADQLTGFCTDFIAAVASASSAQISDVVRAGTSRKRLARVLSGAGPIRLLGWGPSRDVRRPPAKPRKVRGRRVGPPHGAVGWAPQPEAAQPRGDGGLGQGDTGPESLLEQAIGLAKEYLGDHDAEELLRRLRTSEGGE